MSSPSLADILRSHVTLEVEGIDRVYLNVFVGKAQEKTPVIRTEKRLDPRTGRPYAWLVRSTAMVNH